MTAGVVDISWATAIEKMRYLNISKKKKEKDLLFGSVPLSHCKQYLDAVESWQGKLSKQ